MKRILMSLMMIALVGTLAVGSTKAWFTDQEIVPSTLASGKLDVELRGPNSGGVTIALDTTQYFKGGMAPGEEFGPYEVAVYNKGWGQSTIPAKISWRVQKTGGSTKLFNKLNIKVREGNCDWLGAGWFEPNGGWLYGDATSWLSINAMGRVESLMGPLNPNITRCSWFYFELDETADNSYQGLSTQFNLILDATQPENPGWSE